MYNILQSTYNYEEIINLQNWQIDADKTLEEQRLRINDLEGVEKS